MTDDTVRVPREPTQAMLAAGQAAQSFGDESLSASDLRLKWLAMLSAAPQPSGEGWIPEWYQQLNIVRAVLAERGTDPLLVARLDTVLCDMLTKAPSLTQQRGRK